MENYTKGKCVEQPLERGAIPIPNLAENFLWMQVKSGSKMQRLLDHALGVLDNNETRTVVWTGSGEAVLRTISCAESMKRTRKMYQITKIGYRKCEEFWEPKIDGLDKLVVDREIPIVHVMLSLDALDASELGYQDPNVKDAWHKKSSDEKEPKGKPRKRSKVSVDEIFAMGLQTNSGKGRKGPGHPAYKKKNQPGKS